MQKYLFILLFLLSSAIADEWILITPLPHCENFKVEYNFNGEYQIRYKEDLSAPYKIFPKKLKNINNLSDLTDELIEISYGYCPLEIALTEIEGEYLCTPKALSAKPFSKDYVNFLESIIKTVDDSGNNCSDVIPLISLQNKIEQLNPKKLIRFDNSWNPLKLIKGKRTGLLLDHFHECGGKKGSKQFIENLVLLEARNACMFPAPPGLLNFEQAKEIAKEISKRFPKMGLLDLNSSKEKITKETIIKFADKILTTQVEKIFGPTFNSNKFVNSLNVTKQVKSIDAGLALDFSSYVLAVDAPFEIIEKGLPILIDSKFRDMLPESMSISEKTKYLKNIISPMVKIDYDECIAASKERVKFPYNGKVVDLIEHRKSLEKSYCSTNKEQCKKRGCEKSRNFSTQRSDITDLKIIQACLFKGITNAINPLLHKVISGQRDTYKDKLILSNKAVKQVSDEAYKKIYACTDSKIKKIANKDYEEGFTKNIEALYHISSKQYTDSLLECAKNTKEELTGVFATLLIANMAPVKKYFSTNKNIIKFDQKIDKGVHDFANNRTQLAISKCLNAQKSKVSVIKRSAAICRPIIEMEVGKEIIKKGLIETMSKANIASKKQYPIINAFEKCAGTVIKDSSNAIFNKKHTSPILNLNDSTNFLLNNHNYLNCFKTTINAVSSPIITSTIDKRIKENLDKIKNNPDTELKDEDYFISLKEPLIKIVQECFSNKIKSISSWPAFLEFNKKDGIKKLEKKCSLVAKNYALPLIVSNETAKKIGPIITTKLVSLSLADLGEHLKKEYKLNLKINSDEDFGNAINESYKKYKRLHPNKNQNDFIADYSNKIQLKVVGNIRENLLADIVEKEHFSKLKEHIPLQCLNTLYNYNKENIKDLTDLIKKQPKKPKKKDSLKQQFVNLLDKGVYHSLASGRYPQFVETLKEICENPEKVKDIRTFAKTGVGDDVIINIIGTKVKEAFINVAIDQCHKDLKKYEIKLTIENELKLCSSNVEDNGLNSSFVKNLLLTINSPDKKAIVNFINVRKRKAIKLANSKFWLPGVNRLFHEDKTLLNFIYDNFDSVIIQEKSVMDQIKKIATNRIFKDKSKNSFASKFTEMQLVAAIGITGLPSAKGKVKNKIEHLILSENWDKNKAVKWVERQTLVKWIKKNESYQGAIKKYTELLKEAKEPLADLALEQLYKRWNPTGVKGYLNWNLLTDTKREELINELVATNILPRFGESDNQEELKATYSTKIKAHVANYKTIKNPDYIKPKTLKTRLAGYRFNHTIKSSESEYLSFSEKLSKDIGNGVKYSIINGVTQTLDSTN